MQVPEEGGTGHRAGPGGEAPGSVRRHRERGMQARVFTVASVEGAGEAGRAGSGA